MAKSISNIPWKDGRAALTLLCDNPRGISAADVRQKLGVDDNKARRVLDNLVATGDAYKHSNGLWKPTDELMLMYVRRLDSVNADVVDLMTQVIKLTGPVNTMLSSILKLGHVLGTSKVITVNDKE